MFSQKVLFCIELGLLIFAMTIDAKCQQCSKTNYAVCINETAFKICFDDKGLDVSQEIRICPENQVCTGKQGVCKPSDTDKPECGACGQCVTRFACISKTEFEFCDNTGPIGIIGKCPDNEYCSVVNFARLGNICIKSCLDEPTCYAAEKEPTPAPEPDYTKLCMGKSKGFYENTYDSTCRTYVYCEDLNSVIHAILYNCSTNGYFSLADKKCIATKPSKCK